MLIGAFAAGVAAWAARIIVCLAALLAATWFFDAQERKKSRALGLVGGVVGVLGLIAAFFAGRIASGTPVLIAQASTTDITREDRRLYGTATYRFRDGRSQSVQRGSARQLVVNDTPVPLFVSTTLYASSRESPPSLRIEPSEIAQLDARVDHFGWEDRPPPRSDKTERRWLWWERSTP